MTKTLSKGVVHLVPADVRLLLLSDPALPDVWNGLTPLARNEWICFVVSVKKNETRVKHIHRLVHDLKAGKKRPCCFAGCSHRSK